MARCQCAGGSCSCLIQAGPGVQITGTGSSNQPYEISITPNLYEVTFTPTSPVYYVNSTFISDVGSRAVFDVQIDPATTAYITLPNGTINAPYPAPGTELDFILAGTAGSSTVNWAGPNFRWFGSAPSAGNKMGWYRFVFLGDEWAATYLGVPYIP